MRKEAREGGREEGGREGGCQCAGARLYSCTVWVISHWVSERVIARGESRRASGRGGRCERERNFRASEC